MLLHSWTRIEYFLFISCPFQASNDDAKVIPRVILVIMTSYFIKGKYCYSADPRLTGLDLVALLP